jgi:hypothetical protein
VQLKVGQKWTLVHPLLLAWKGPQTWFVSLQWLGQLAALLYLLPVLVLKIKSKTLSADGLRFTNFKTLLFMSLTSNFPIKSSARRENCDSRAWWSSAWRCFYQGIKYLAETTTYIKFLIQWKFKIFAHLVNVLPHFSTK